MSDENEEPSPEEEDIEVNESNDTGDDAYEDDDNGDKSDDVQITGADERPEETLRRLREQSRQGGGPDRIEKQHERGKKTARERLEYLFDADSFEEIDSLIERRSYEFYDEKEHLPGDGVVCGFGEINGRRVACYSQDFTVMGGSLSEENGKKICKLMDLAERYGLPIVGINDSGGARIQEGVRSLASYAEIFKRNTDLSGEVPQISLIMGPCAGGAVYSPAISDLIFMVEDTSFMYVTGPEVVRTVTREDMSHRELGGSDVHRSESGVADLVGEQDKDVLDMAVRALSYLPDHRDDTPSQNSVEPPSVSEPLNKIVPEDKTRPYDVRRVVEAVVDGDSFMELKPDFAKNLVIGFARLDGHAIGVVANQPKYNAGTLDIDASDKGARFVRLCDNFNLPILTLEDVPGFMPGKDQEAGGIIRHGAKLLYAYAEAAVPMITLVTRKAYGGAYCVMASKHLGADFNFAWPMAELAVMGPESAVEILHGDEIQQAEDPQTARQEKLEDLRYRFGNPWEAARRGYLDDVIQVEESRSKLISALEIALNGRDDDRRNPHGNIPL